jgi:hypothetical protein
MNCPVRRALVLSILVLAPDLKQGSAQVRPDASGPPAARPRTPFGVYAVVGVEDVVAAQLKANPAMTTAQLDTYFASFYTGLLNNPAVAGLTLQVHWDTLNPNAPTDASPYSWDYVDDAFSSVAQWNTANLDAPMPNPKTIQLIVTPGFNSPQWVRDQLTSCDGLFASPPVSPGSTCGMATFTNFNEGGDSTELPMPWNVTYKSDWKTFLTALAARYGNSSLVSIAVAGPTAASAEMLLPNGDTANQTQFSGGAISPNQMWDQLLANHYGSGKPAYLMSDQAFIDAWNDAIDMYGEVFSGLTLVATTGDGLPNLSTSGFSVLSAFKAYCTVKMDMDCAAETAILSHFVESSVGGGNGKATQTSGMEASRSNLNLDVADVKLLAQTDMAMPTASTRILGGAQFNTRFSQFAVQEGCTSSFPPIPMDTPVGCTIEPWADQGVVPVTCIPSACLAPGVTISDLQAALYTEFKQVPASDLISPEQAAYNVLELYFNGTPAATFFGGTTGGEPLNYLQIYYQDIQYATNNASSPAKVVQTDGTTISETAQSMLNLASAKLFAIAEIEP